MCRGYIAGLAAWLTRSSGSASQMLCGYVALDKSGSTQNLCRMCSQISCSCLHRRDPSLVLTKRCLHLLWPVWTGSEIRISFLACSACVARSGIELDAPAADKHDPMEPMLRLRYGDKHWDIPRVFYTHSLVLRGAMQTGARDEVVLPPEHAADAVETWLDAHDHEMTTDLWWRTFKVCAPATVTACTIDALSLLSGTRLCWPWLELLSRHRDVP